MQTCWPSSNIQKQSQLKNDRQFKQKEAQPPRWAFPVLTSNLPYPASVKSSASLNRTIDSAGISRSRLPVSPAAAVPAPPPASPPISNPVPPEAMPPINIPNPAPPPIIAVD